MHPSHALWAAMSPPKLRVRLRLGAEGGGDWLSYNHTSAVGVMVMHEGRGVA